MDCANRRRCMLVLMFLLASAVWSQGGCDNANIHPAQTDCSRLTLLELHGRISFQNTTDASRDWGLMKRLPPAGILYPEAVYDITSLIHVLATSDANLTVAAKGRGHSVNGQAQAHNGIVIDMSTLRGIKVMPMGDVDTPMPFVEASAGELWVDVLEATLKEGLAPRSWTDYLYLTVGGTLSNAGVSGQSFRYGPEISNVLQLEVVTGNGELVTCSPDKEDELFYAVLGGLGQFGIITKARIILEPAPEKVRWIRAIYTDFEAFRKDQEMLISETNVLQTFDYIEGFLVLNNDSPAYGWKSVPFVPDQINASMIPEDAGSILYYIELTKTHNSGDIETLEQRVKEMLTPLSFVPHLLFSTDVPYFDFLNRIHKVEVALSEEGLWDNIPHPWLNLFIPGSSVTEFDAHVFKQLGSEDFSGPILVYALNRDKWDRRASAVVPDEDVFYIVAFLKSNVPSSGPSLGSQIEWNSKVLSLCESLGGKQYLPQYYEQAQWERHFGSQWGCFCKSETDV